MNSEEWVTDLKDLVVQGASLMGEYTPLISKLVTGVRLNRFENRLKKKRKKLNEIFYYLKMMLNFL
ncbi:MULTISPECIES: hypothetical protein [Lysinibacillus]|uniref:hypothetical protein n=1 Tax=Lysinibacillus TaxID=400634 RepID=UPI00214B9ABD|nr:MULTISPECIES: hypothetical protein [Lysinibacillus]UUV25838.1 hypothetical protein NP781_04275 [Lysinibacillus sp. FN11]UYB48712.1 hypothetical protein OCI51_07070 [Lysinibacillus capsici]